MPDIATHYRFAESALKALPEKCRGPIDRAVFDTASAGPDTWFFKDFWKHLSPNEIANRMHKEGGTALLTLLTQAAKADENAKDALYSYVCGFLCHYTLDHHTHPYIRARSAGARGGHMKLERCIDCAELSEWKDSGLFSITRKIFRLKQVGVMKNALDRAYRQVYGIADAAEEMNGCIRAQRAFYVLAQEPSGIVDVLLRFADSGKGKTDLTAVCYRRKENAYVDPMNLSRFEWAAGRSETFPELRENALREVLPLLERVHAYLYEDGAMPQYPELVG